MTPTSTITTCNAEQGQKYRRDVLIRAVLKIRRHVRV